MKLKKVLLASFLGSLFFTHHSHAADITWSGATDTNWNVNTNWVGNALPVSNDTVIFGAPGVGGLTLNNNRTSAAFTLNGFLFTDAAGAYVIGDGTNTANAGSTFVLGAPAATAFYGASVTNASRNTQTIHTPFSMTGTRVFTGLGDIVITGNISGTGGALTKTGSNTLTLSGTNTQTGTTNINLGVLRLDSTNAIPGGIGASGGLGNINFNNGIIGLGAGDFFRPLGSGASAVQFSTTSNGGWAAFGANRIVNLGGASASVVWVTNTTGLSNRTLILSHPTATHALDFQNPLDLTNGGRTIQVDDGAATIDGILSGNLTGVSGGNLTKNGGGTLALTGGANNYAGTTTINAGTVLVNGTKSGSGTLTVNIGAALGGTGSITGATTVSAGGRINLINGSVGNLNFTNNITFSGTSASPNLLNFDLGNGSAGTDKIITAGAHNAASSNGSLVFLNQLSGTPLTPGTYPLIQGGAASNMTGYTLATARAGRNIYTNLVPNGNNLDVDVAEGDAGPAVPFLYWRGEVAGDWDSNSEWYVDAAGDTPAAEIPGYSSNVRFATANADILATNLFQDFEINSLTTDAGLAAPITIGTRMLTIGATADNGNTLGNGITVNNESGTTISSRVGLGNSQTWTVGTDATLTVSGAIYDFGAGHSLTKAGPGTLNLSGVNAFAGPLTISGGTLAITGSGQLNNGTYTKNLVNNGTFTYNSSAAQTFQGIISGSGSLVKSGSSTLTILNSGTFTGDATINNGTLSLGSANLVNPLGTGTTTVNTGGTYALSATLLSAPLVLNGGTITAGNSFTSSINSAVTLNAVSTLNITGNLTINGNISGTGGLTKTGSAFIFLNGTNDYSGPTTIGANGGGLTIKSSLYGNDTAKWIPANITVNSGGALVLNVGGTGEFTIAQAGLMFAQLGGEVNNNGLRAGSTFGVDLRNTSGTFSISDNLADTTGTGGGSVSFRIVGNGITAGAVVELTGENTYSGQTIVDRSGAVRVSSLNSVNGGNPPLANSSLGRPTTIANGTIQLGTSATFQGASLIYTGTGETTDRVLSMGGGGNEFYRLEQAGSGLLKFTSNMAMTDTRGPKSITLQGSTSGTAEMAGVIPNATSSTLTTSVTKAGSGTWTLSAANTFVGLTTVTGGTLVLANANALNGGIGATGGLGALTLNGGVIGLAAGDFQRPLAAANTIGACTFSGAGGWAAYGADRSVNLGGASAAINWGAAGTGLNGQTLILGSVTATHTVNFQNPLTLSGNRTVRVDNGAAAIDGILSGALVGNILTKSGEGTLLLIGTADNNSMVLNASAGVVILGKTPIGGAHAVAGISNIATGATVQLAGTGGNQIFNGGFNVAFGLVNMSGGTLDLNGLNEAVDLVTGTGSVTNSVAATTSTLTVGSANGSGSFGGVISNGAGVLALTKTGTGTVTLTGLNTYSGNTVVSSGTLALADDAQLRFVLGATSGSNNSITGAGTVTLEGDFVIDTTAADALSSGTWTLENVDTLTGAYGANFTVVGFTPAAGDTWTKNIGGGKTYTFDETTGILTLTSSGTPYDTWASAKGLTIANNAKNLDPDNDGKNNLYEFAFDGDPLSGVNDGKVVGKVATVGGNQVLTLTLPVRGTAPAPTFSLDSGDRVSVVVDGIIYRIEADEVLATFADTITEVTGPDATAIQSGLPTLSSGWSYRTFRAPGTTTSTGKAFIRASVTTNP